MSRVLLVFLLFQLTHAAPSRLFNQPNAYFCANPTLRDAVHAAMDVPADNLSVDLIQNQIEESLKPYFLANGGVWLVSAASYHRVNGYVDDRASESQTFCAINNNNLNVNVVIVRIQ
ncbi:unnamed protein product [Caenorhabditis auriculariae]|uniref:Ground-like domain-containing protein n=1 Tax=Caenorhabditis auriculariae TaxID=2777116 RepID=A0A8S1HFU3_9PELO|nr:unnamed protein product [Caenorhabditis auriculariae]